VPARGCIFLPARLCQHIYLWAMQGWTAPCGSLQLPRCESDDDDDDGDGERLSIVRDVGGSAGARARHSGGNPGGAGAPPLLTEQSGELRSAHANASAAVEQLPSLAANPSLAASGGARRHAAVRTLRSPESFIGCTVCRAFDGVPYTGTVVEAFRSGGQQLWHVVYTDGDEEGYNQHQLLSYLQPEGAPAVPLSQQEQEPQYKGVKLEPVTGLYRMEVHCGRGPHITTPFSFPTAEAAACAFDKVIRERGFTVVNFPRPGSDEVQAVPGESMACTLKRARALQGGDVPTGQAAAAPAVAPPPPSAAPRARRKRVRVHGAAAAPGGAVAAANGRELTRMTSDAAAPGGAGGVAAPAAGGSAAVDGDDHAAAECRVANPAGGSVARPAAADGGAPVVPSSRECLTVAGPPQPAAPAAGAPQSEVARVQAFLRSISPPLSQVRLLARARARAHVRAGGVACAHTMCYAVHCTDMLHGFVRCADRCRARRRVWQRADAGAAGWRWKHDERTAARRVAEGGHHKAAY
jgi:hypothetical protein